MSSDLLNRRLQIAISNAQHENARKQLGLSSDYALIDATGLLAHDTGNGQVQIQLPPGLVVAMFENTAGHRRYGVVWLVQTGSSH
ncbi:hypothetical protein [Pseudomonas protegens]|uniref:hypothetical protein n=1 Tax=Pseudomonas protegens TaxID=380021 RepID=UPI0037F5E43C